MKILFSQRPSVDNLLHQAEFQGKAVELAVKILEFFDHCDFAQRTGNEHLLHDSQMFR